MPHEADESTAAPDLSDEVRYQSALCCACSSPIPALLVKPQHEPVVPQHCKPKPSALNREPHTRICEAFNCRLQTRSSIICLNPDPNGSCLLRKTLTLCFLYLTHQSSEISSEGKNCWEQFHLKSLQKCSVPKP